MLLITFDCFIDSLFNINKDIFNRKKTLDVFRQKFCSLEHNNYYASYFFCRDTTIEARNSSVLKTIIMFLDC